MKYYVCSPMGRTGSKRIVSGILSTLKEYNKDQKRMFISTPGDYSKLTQKRAKKNSFFYDGFKLFDANTSKVESDTYTKEEGIKVMNEWDKPTVLHSHDADYLPTTANGWKFILSSRKRKIDVVLSLIVAQKTHSLDPDHEVNPQLVPFEIELKTIEFLMNYFIVVENKYIENIRQLTGKFPTVIYLEDNWQMVQQKAGMQFIEKAADRDTYSISSHRAVDWVTNYDSIQKFYNENLSYYQSKFMTDTL